jgi:hypothetical protein
MAVTAAVRQLEVMQNREETTSLARTPRQAAGITIVIETGQSARVLNPPMIDAAPVETEDDIYARLDP